MNKARFAHEGKRWSEGKKRMSWLCFLGIHDWERSTCRRCARHRARCLKVIEGCPDVMSLASTPDGRVISGSGGYDCNVRVWNLQTATCEKVLDGHGGWVQAVAVTPGGKAVSASRDFTLRVWNYETGSCDMVLRGHENYVNALAQLPGERIVSADGGGTIRIWNLSTGLCERVIVTGHCWPLKALAVVGSRRIVSGSQSPARGQLAADALAIMEGRPKDPTIVPDADDCIKVWDTASGRCIRTLHRQSQGRFVFNNHGCALAVTADGKLVSIGESPRETPYCSVRVWDLVTGNFETVIDGISENNLLVTPDYRAVIPVDEALTVWDLRSGRLEMKIKGQTACVEAVVVDFRGRIISGSGDGTIRVWDIGVFSSEPGLC